MKRWWQRRTLRFRLASWYAGGGVLLFTAFSLTLYLFVDARMAQPLDRQLRRDLLAVDTRLTFTAEGRIVWEKRIHVQGEPWSWNDPWFEVWDEQGNLVGRQWPLDEARLDQLPFAPAAGRETISVFNVATDLRLRVLSAPLEVPGAKPGWMVRVLRVHKPAADALSALLLIIVIALPTVVGLLVLGGYLITLRWLLPLDEMAAEAEQIGANDLSRRLPVVNPHDELGRLARVFNATLARLEDSFGALDRFAVDASHELRTPLTTLRSVGEVALQRSRSEPDYRETIASMLEEAQRLQALVERLLELARVAGGGQDAPRMATRVDSLVSACIAELGVLAEERGQHLVLDVVECTVRTDPVLFRQALQNLVDNAIKFSPPGTEIRIVVRATPEACTVEVMDEGPGIEPGLQARVHERFFRADPARTVGGHGLGLAITHVYAQALGGTLAYVERLPRGSIFRLVLPSA